MPTLPSRVRLVAFDLDDTLAPSKTAIEPEMAALLAELLELALVCVISGGQYGQFQMQVVDRLDLAPEAASRLHLMPTCGTQYYRYGEAGFEQVYARTLTQDERDRTWASLEHHAKRLGLWQDQTWGPILEDRGSQVTFSALGQAAPVDAKAAWDPTGEKKSSLRDAVAVDLPDLEVRSGGSTSVDVTRKGIDKAYGMRQLVEQTGVPLEEMLFVGDRLDPAGNDYPVLALGVACHAVHGWQDTDAYLRDTLIPELRGR